MSKNGEVWEYAERIVNAIEAHSKFVGTVYRAAKAERGIGSKELQDAVHDMLKAKRSTDD